MNRQSLNIGIFILIVVVIMLNQCDSKNNSQQAAVDVAQPAEEPNVESSQTEKTTWPNSPQDIVLASNQLAVNYYLLIDGSGSMADVDCAPGSNKMTLAKKAVQEFIGKIPANDNIGLMSFDSTGIREKVALGSDRERVLREVMQIDAGGGTPLKSSIKKAYEALTKQAQSQLGYGEYHLVIVTDGEANSGEDPKPIVRKISKESSVVIHTIGFCIDKGHSLNIPGKTHYSSANNPQELAEGLTQVLAEANEYIIDEFK
jgi:Ca-activated chloride channel homolog